MFVEGLLDLFQAGVLKREVDGAVLHAAFFIGSRAFYRTCGRCRTRERAKFQMTPVAFVNELYGDEESKRRARVDARFMNDAMMATVLGDIVSDGLDNGQIVSGVGGQYNFVAQGFALEGAHSVIMLRSHRTTNGNAQSNIRWNYGHIDDPAPPARHHRHRIRHRRPARKVRSRRDRGHAGNHRFPISGRTVAAAPRMPARSSDPSRFPQAAKDNTPDAIARALQPARDAGLLPTFPFGTDFTRGRAEAAAGARDVENGVPHATRGLVAPRLVVGARRSRLSRTDGARPSRPA